MFALGGFLKLAGDLFALIGPLAIQQIVQYIEGLYAAAQEEVRAQVHAQAATANRSIIQLEGMGGPNAAADGADVVYYEDYDVANDDGDYNDMGLGSGLGLGIGIGDVRIYYARWSDLLTNGWSIAWLVLLAALAQAALSQASTHVLNMTGIRIKTSLQGLIYRKSLLLNASSGCGNNAADDDDKPATGSDSVKVRTPAAAATATTSAADVQQNGKNIRLTPNDKPVEVTATQQQQQQQTERSGGECLAQTHPTHPFIHPPNRPSPCPPPLTTISMCAQVLFDRGKCAFGVN